MTLGRNPWEFGGHGVRFGDPKWGWGNGDPIFVPLDLETLGHAGEIFLAGLSHFLLSHLLVHDLQPLQGCEGRAPGCAQAAELWICPHRWALCFCQVFCRALLIRALVASLTWVWHVWPLLALPRWPRLNPRSFW